MISDERVREVRREVSLVTVTEVCERIVALEELVGDYDRALDACVDVWGAMADVLGYGRKYDALHARANELGIEVG